MIKIMTRKCEECKQQIYIEYDDIKNVVLYKGKYYHSDCFVNTCTRKSASKRGNPAEWEQALSNISAFESDAAAKLNELYIKDTFNDYLLDNYKVTTVPKRFWTAISELENGIYRGKRCKPIDVHTLLSMWQWGRERLRKIEMQHVGPQDGNQRLLYDLAILINHSYDYYNHLKKIKSMEAERKQNEQQEIKIDYSKIQTKTKNSGLDDISDLLDDMI